MPRTMSPEQEVRFAVFWAAYPKHRAKIDAQRAWRRLNPSDDDLDAILKGIGRYMRSGEWNDPQFIPYPTTFLNQRRWEDDIAGKYTAPVAQEPCFFKKGYVPRIPL